MRGKCASNECIAAFLVCSSIKNTIANDRPVVVVVVVVLATSTVTRLWKITDKHTDKQAPDGVPVASLSEERDHASMTTRKLLGRHWMGPTPPPSPPCTTS